MHGGFRQALRNLEAILEDRFGDLKRSDPLIQALYGAFDRAWTTRRQVYVYWDGTRYTSTDRPVCGRPFVVDHHGWCD